MGTRLGTELGTTLGTVLGTDLGGAGGGMSYPSAVASLTGITGFNTSNLLRSPALNGPQGSNGGFTQLIACRIKSQVSSAYILEFLDGFKGGRVHQPSATQVEGYYGDGISATPLSPWYYPAGSSDRATDLNRDQILCFTHSGTNGYIDQWEGQPNESAAKVGRGTPAVAYAAPTTGSVRTTFGARGNGSAAHTGLTMYAVAEWSRVLTRAEIHAVYDFYYANGRFPVTGDPELPANATHVYNFVTDIAANGGAIPTTILDRVGTGHLTFSLGNTTGFSVEANSSSFVFTNVPPAPCDVLIAFGDSMTDGRGDPADLAAVYPAYPNPPTVPLNPALRMLRAPVTVYFWEGLKDPSGTGAAGASSCVGPWGLLTSLAGAASGRQAALVNGGQGGSQSSVWVPGQNTGNLFRNGYEVACSRRNATFRAVLIYGGPNDAAASASPAYLANVQTVLAMITARLGPIPVTIQCKLTAAIPTDVSYPGWASVQADIAALAGANHLLITPPSPANREAYNLHHKTDQNYTIAQAALTLLQGHATWPWT